MSRSIPSPLPANASALPADDAVTQPRSLVDSEGSGLAIASTTVGHRLADKFEAHQQIGSRPAILWMFGVDWAALAAARFASSYDIRTAGFDLFSFPSNASLLWFDIERFVNRQVARGGKLNAVLSHEEQFGALCAALVAERLGLPGTPPEAILRLQHKLICRDLIEAVAPEANVGYSVLDCELGDLPDQALDFPAFVKPIKASFSVLAKRVESLDDLRRHVSFGRFERLIIKRLVTPFDEICRKRLPDAVGARHMLVEESIQTDQFNLDGYVFGGKAQSLGVVDEIMYPGTQAFLRFMYPSKLPSSVQDRAFDVARRVLEAAGFDHGFFNMEFFYDRATDRLSVIEFNPRLAAQLADLYERVDGIDVHGMSVALALGKDPARVPRYPSRAGAAASCALRTFDGTMPTALSQAHLKRVRDRHPDTVILTFDKSESGRKREYKWMGSNRYGVLNLHGDNEEHLHERYAAVCSELGWPAPF